MSFTEDELQAFNAILEKRLAAHRQEIEAALDQRLYSLQREIHQRFISLPQEMHILQKALLDERENKRGADSSIPGDTQQGQFEQTIEQIAEQKLHQVEVIVDRMMAAQLLGIEQLLNQDLAGRTLERSSFAREIQPQFESIEVQTELPWEDLAEMVGKALDERLALLNDTLQRSLKNLEQYLAMRLHNLRDEIARSSSRGQPYSAPASDMTSVQEILGGIEQLGRIVDSMQVAMTANHALLSNRLYHHQQLPLERAHPAGLLHGSPVNGANSLLAQAKERVANGQEPGVLTGQKEIEEPGRQ